MLVEEKTYRLLSQSEDLSELLDTLRGGPLVDGNDEEINAIFVGDTPDIFNKEEMAPFIRINPIDEKSALFADNLKMAEKQTVQIDWWCAGVRQAEAIKVQIDKIMESNDFRQYYSDRYDDPEIDLKMNVRKYETLEIY